MLIPNKLRGFRSAPINALIDCVRALQPLAGENVEIRRSPSGTIISSTGGGGGGGISIDSLFAWKVREDGIWEDEEEDTGGTTGGETGGDTGGETGGEEEEKPKAPRYQVFAPIAVINGSALQEAPDGYTTAFSWQDIPREDTEASSSSGFTLYAILRYAPASGGSSGSVQEGTGLSFTLKPTLPDTSKDPKGTIYRLIPIAQVDGEGAITQLHAGVIIETFPTTNLSLGPIEYDDQTKNVVQFLGSYDASGNFKKAVDANGQYLIGADYGKPLSALRAESSDSIYTFTGFKPLGTDEKYGKFAEKHTFTGGTKDLTYTAPETEDGMGALSAVTGISFDFWGSKPTDGAATTLLQTVIESANDKNTYESASS